MTDQAATLRAMRAARAPLGAAGEVPCVVVASGKGGVGKSLTAVALAAASAASGTRTLLVDGDQNLGNLHVLLGVQPEHSLAEVVRGEVGVEALVTPVTEHLSLVPADSGSDLVQGLTPTDRARLHRQVSTLFPSHEAVVVDAAAGLEATIRCAAMRATRLVLVTLPEPSALTDAYAVTKLLTAQVPHLAIDVLVNRTTDPREGDAAWERLATAAARFLDRGLGFAGAIPDDPAMRTRTRTPRTLLAPADAGPALAALAALAPERFAMPHPAELEPARTAR